MTRSTQSSGKRRKVEAPTLPEPLMTEAIHERIKDMGLVIMTFQNVATTVQENGRSYWIPRNLMGSDGALILWKVAGADDNGYGFDGWGVQLGPHTHGGMHKTLGTALGWVEIARGVRDGKYSDFSGRPTKTR